MTRSPEEIKRDGKAAFEEFDPLQMAIFRQMPSSRKMQLQNSWSMALQQLVIDAVKQEYPTLSAQRTAQKAMLRCLSATDWKDESWKTFFSS